MTTIASLSPAPTVRILAATALYFAVLTASVVLAVGDLARGEGQLIWLGVAGLVAVLVARGVLEQIFLVGALLSSRRALLREENGALVHFSPMTGRVEIGAIDEVAIVHRRRGFGRRLHVLIKTGRREIMLMTDLCAESGQEIVDRLRALS